jgi:hypothetical protein
MRLNNSACAEPAPKIDPRNEASLKPLNAARLHLKSINHKTNQRETNKMSSIQNIQSVLDSINAVPANR